MSNRRFYTPAQTEILTHPVVEMSREAEQAVVAQFVETAKKAFRLGDKIVMDVDVKYIHIPAWQRRMDYNRAADIAKHYNSAAFDLPKVYLGKDGRLYVGEGQHRIVAVYLNEKMTSVLCEFCELTEKEMQQLFLDQDERRKEPSISEKFNAGLSAGRKEYANLYKICCAHNVAIRGYNESPDSNGTFTNLREGLRDALNSEELCAQIFNIITDANWRGSLAYGSKNYRAVKKVIAKYGYSKVYNKLCKMTSSVWGCDWYTDYVEGHRQSEIIDVLSRAVEGKSVLQFKNVQ